MPMRVPGGGRVRWILLIPLRIPPKRAKDDGAMSEGGERNKPETGIARTGATGAAMLSELVTWSSSLHDDLQFWPMDVLGSAAHVTMLGRTGLVSADDARQLRALRVQRAGEWIAIDLTANAFLHHMVRNIVGLLLAIGTGRAPPERAREQLQSRVRREGEATAAALGLYFWHAEYPSAFGLPAASAIIAAALGCDH